jgi:hypothetical protein
LFVGFGSTLSTYRLLNGIENMLQIRTVAQSVF